MPVFKQDSISPPSRSLHQAATQEQQAILVGTFSLEVCRHAPCPGRSRSQCCSRSGVRDGNNMPGMKCHSGQEATQQHQKHTCGPERAGKVCLSNLWLAYAYTIGSWLCAVPRRHHLSHERSKPSDAIAVEWYHRDSRGFAGAGRFIAVRECIVVMLIERSIILSPPRQILHSPLRRALRVDKLYTLYAVPLHVLPRHNSHYAISDPRGSYQAQMMDTRYTFLQSWFMLQHHRLLEYPCTVVFWSSNMPWYFPSKCSSRDIRSRRIIFVASRRVSPPEKARLRRRSRDFLMQVK